jgi:hypothetical protein
MLVRPNEHPLNWFPYEVTGSLELLEAYVKDIESQVAKGVADFKMHVETEVIEPDHPEEPARFITHHRGLDDETWDLRSIFEGYFPSLQRRSALITLYAFFEYELDKLCRRVKAESGYKIDLSDIGDKGILRSTTYLLKVADMDGIRGSKEWQEIRKIQSIRNLIVHADGKLPPSPDGRKSKIDEYVEQSARLQRTDDGDLNITEGYLAHCLMTFHTYFEQLHAALRRKYEA